MTVFSIADALARRIDELETRREPDGMWHPSALFGCTRRAAYAIRGTQESNPTDPRGKRVFRVGHLMHELVQDAVMSEVARGVILRAYVELPIEVPDLLVRGSADLLVQLVNGRWRLYELKSIKSTGFKYKDLPQADHVSQWATYCMGLRRYGSVDRETGAVIVPPLGPLLDEGLIVYVSKDDMEIGEYPVHYTPAREREILDRVSGLEPYRDPSAPLPSRLPVTLVKGKEKKDWRCGYCPFADLCWADDSARGRGKRSPSGNSELLRTRRRPRTVGRHLGRVA